MVLRRGGRWREHSRDDPGNAVGRKGENRRLLCLVTDDSHGLRISRKSVGVAKENSHE